MDGDVAVAHRARPDRSVAHRGVGQTGHAQQTDAARPGVMMVRPDDLGAPQQVSPLVTA